MQKTILTMSLVLLMVAGMSNAEKAKIVYTPEYVAQYLGKLITVTFINDNEEFNRITFTMEGVIVKYQYGKNYQTQYKKEIRYFIIGESTNAKKILIEINQIRTIKKTG